MWLRGRHKEVLPNTIHTGRGKATNINSRQEGFVQAQPSRWSSFRWHGCACWWFVTIKPFLNKKKLFLLTWCGSDNQHTIGRMGRRGELRWRICCPGNQNPFSIYPKVVLSHQQVPRSCCGPVGKGGTNWSTRLGMRYHYADGGVERRCRSGMGQSLSPIQGWPWRLCWDVTSEELDTGYEYTPAAIVS